MVIDGEPRTITEIGSFQVTSGVARPVFFSPPDETAAATVQIPVSVESAPTDVRSFEEVTALHRDAVHGADLAIGPDGSVAFAGAVSPNVFPDDVGGRYAQPPTGTTGADISLDAYVVKYAADGSHVEYVTYYGGRHKEKATGVAIGPDGQVVFVGDLRAEATATDADVHDLHLPGSLQALDLRDAGSFATTAAFVVTLGPTGKPDYGTYLNSQLDDYAADVAIDAEGRIVVTGTTGGGLSGSLSQFHFPAAGSARWSSTTAPTPGSASAGSTSTGASSGG